MAVVQGPLCLRRSWMLQKSQVERSEHQDDSYVRHEPFQEAVPEEQEIHTDHGGDHQHYVEYGRYLSRHFGHQLPGIFLASS